MPYFYAVSAIDLITRLQELNLLPDTERPRHVEAVRDLATSTPDGGFLNSGIVGFLTEEERKSILEDIRQKLLPDLEKKIVHWRMNYDDNEDPEQYFEPLQSALREIQSGLDSDDDTSHELIDTAVTRIDTMVEELKAEAERPPEWENSNLGAQTMVEPPATGRSIFDDVDQ